MRKKLSVQNLAQAIEFALQPDIRQKVRAMGETLRKENGVQTAAQIILNELAEKATR